MSFIEIFLPPRCAGCDTVMKNGLPLCEECEKLFIRPAPTKNSCELCGFSLKECICVKHQYFEKLIPCFFYEDKPKRTVLKMKFGARPDIAKNFARLLYRSLDERGLLSQTDAITFIPMSRYRQFSRGYNQAEILARHLAVLCNKPCIPFLFKDGKAAVQHDLKKSGRKGNILGIYEPCKDYENDIRGKRILVVDDIATTYSTINEAAKTLLIFGAEGVFAAVCTITKKKK